MSEINTVQGGPIVYKQASQTPIARARQHIRAAIAVLKAARDAAMPDPALDNRMLDISHILHDLYRIDGEHDTLPWAYPMSLARLEGAHEVKAPEGEEKP